MWAGTVSPALIISKAGHRADDSCAQPFAGNTFDPGKKTKPGLSPRLWNITH